MRCAPFWAAGKTNLVGSPEVPSGRSAGSAGMQPAEGQQLQKLSQGVCAGCHPFFCAACLHAALPQLPPSSRQDERCRSPTPFASACRVGCRQRMCRCHYWQQLGPAGQLTAQQGCQHWSLRTQMRRQAPLADMVQVRGPCCILSLAGTAAEVASCWGIAQLLHLKAAPWRCPGAPCRSV